MSVSIVQWRVEAWKFNLKSFMRLVKSIFSVNFRTTFPSNFFILLCAVTLLQISGDIELNSGPKKTKVRVRMSRSEMFVFQKIWRTLFSCNIHFEIRPVALFPTNLSFFHLNFNIITAHNFRKISLFEAYINLIYVFVWSLHKSHICIFETNLDTSFPDDYVRLTVPG